MQFHKKGSMGYEKAMRHTRNVRKCRKQSRQYMGFAASTSPWPNPRRHPVVGLLIQIGDWYRTRHQGDSAHNRDCIREAIQELRELRVQAKAAASVAAAA